MIRILLGAALPVLGLGIAAATFGPDLVTGPRGEPLIMAAADQASLQAARFEGDACSSALLFAGPSPADEPPASGTRIVAFALRSGADDVAVAVEDFSDGSDIATETVVLIFDAAGHLIAAGDPSSLRLPAGDTIASDCPPDVAPI